MDVDTDEQEIPHVLDEEEKGAIPDKNHPPSKRKSKSSCPVHYIF